LEKPEHFYITLKFLFRSHKEKVLKIFSELMKNFLQNALKENEKLELNWKFSL